MTARAAACFAVLYVVRIFARHGGYHRYFAHRAFQTSRPFAALARRPRRDARRRRACSGGLRTTAPTTATRTQLGPALAAAARLLVRPRRLDLRQHRRDRLAALLRDFARYPELRWLDRRWLLPPALLALATLPTAAASGTPLRLLLQHRAHLARHLHHQLGRALSGSRRFATTDDSRNNSILALFTLGEGWHNNHHHAARSVRLGLRWWEIDVGYYVIRLLAALGLVWALREPSAAMGRGDT